MGAGTSGGGTPPRSRVDQKTLVYTTLEVKHAGTLRNCMKQEESVCGCGCECGCVAYDLSDIVPSSRAVAERQLGSCPCDMYSSDRVRPRLWLSKFLDHDLQGKMNFKL